MPSVHVRIKLTATECLEFYTSQAPNVVTHSIDGRSVMFPRRIIRQMVGPNGVDGLFRINFNDSGQFVSIERVAS